MQAPSPKGRRACGLIWYLPYHRRLARPRKNKTAKCLAASICNKHRLQPPAPGAGHAGRLSGVPFKSLPPTRKETTNATESNRHPPRHRNNYLYGTATSDGIDGDLGNDYLRGTRVTIICGAARARTVLCSSAPLAQNGYDIIKDYMYAPTATGAEVDVLDFSLVGFARNALSRNSGTPNGIDNVIRFVDDGEGGGARVEVSLTGQGGGTFQTWAVLRACTSAILSISASAHRPSPGRCRAGLAPACVMTLATETATVMA